jgi:hypothetical protein
MSNNSIRVSDPAHPALNGVYEPGTVTTIDYYKEERKPWESVNIMLTATCKMACWHCCTNSGPLRRETMSRELLDALLDELALINKTRWLCFLGGEPLLHPELLQHGLRRSRELGMLPSVVTAGGWANTEQDAKRLATHLSESDSVVFSIDKPHLNFVSIPAFFRAIDAVLNYSIHTSVNFVGDANQFLGIDNIPEELVHGCRERGIGIVMTPMTDSGRAQRHLDRIPEMNIGSRCGRTRLPLVDPTGNVVSCALGYTIPTEAKSRHVLGKFPNESLQIIYDKYWGSANYRILEEEGPLALLMKLNPELGRKVSACPSEFDLKTPCSVCRLIAETTKNKRNKLHELSF